MDLFDLGRTGPVYRHLHVRRARTVLAILAHPEDQSDPRAAVAVAIDLPSRGPVGQRGRDAFQPEQARWPCPTTIPSTAAVGRWERERVRRQRGRRSGRLFVKDVCGSSGSTAYGLEGVLVDFVGRTSDGTSEHSHQRRPRERPTTTAVENDRRPAMERERRGRGLVGARATGHAGDVEVANLSGNVVGHEQISEGAGPAPAVDPPSSTLEPHARPRSVRSLPQDPHPRSRRDAHP